MSKEHAPVGAVFINPISAYLGVGDSNDSGQVRAALTPARELFARKKVAGLYIGHPRKDASGSAIDQHAGSSGIPNAVRNVFIAMDDPTPDEDGNPRSARLFLRETTNLLREEPWGFSYEIVPTEARMRKRMPDGRIDEHGIIAVSKIRWVAEDKRRPDEVLELAREMARPLPDEKAATAMALILQALWDGKPKLADHLDRVRQDAGIADWSWRRARDRLKKEALIESFGKGRDIVWSLGSGKDVFEAAQQPATAKSGSTQSSPPDDAVADWLRKRLASGAVEVGQLTQEAADRGIAEATLTRIRKAMGVVKVPPQEMGGVWMAALPDGDPPEATS